MVRALAITVGLCVLGGGNLSAQAPASSANNGPSTAVSNLLPLYRAFFKNVQFLDDEAAKAEALHKPDAAELRSHYQRNIDLADAEAVALKQTAAANVAAVEQMDLRAQQVIRDHHAKYPGGRVPKGEPLPTPPPELYALNRQRDDVTTAQLQILKASLGADGFKKVDDYLQTRFARNLNTTPLKNFQFPTPTVPKGVAQ